MPGAVTHSFPRWPPEPEHDAAAAPPASHALDALDSGAWVWQPQAWRDGGDALVRSAAARGVKHLYITLVIAAGEVEHRPELASFIRAAGRANIAVEAVEGDPHMILSEGLANALARARAIARYQEKVPAAARLAGIQYDIEPYVLPGWGTNPVDHAAWSDAVIALAQAAGGPVHLVLPFWIADEPAGVRFLRDVEASVKAVTVMSYRTDSALAASLAEPLLHWGGKAGKPVRIALEAGPVACEAEEVLVPDASGRSAPIETDAMDAGRGAIRTPSDRISFLGDEQRMFAAAREVARVASAWRAFAGIGFHGLALSNCPEGSLAR
jgi:hypothetical protein